MSNAFSRQAPGSEIAFYKRTLHWYSMHYFQWLALHQSGNLLGLLPTEIRLMIFEELLSVWPKKVFRGAESFGKLDKKEFDGIAEIPWQILLTCRKFYAEALPILYSKNKFAFCTGTAGSPGSLMRFPIKTINMPFLTNLSIYFRADTPTKEAAKRVALFLQALAHHAGMLKHLNIVIGSDRRYEYNCPWDVVFCDHPVVKMLMIIIEMAVIPHIRIRFHDGSVMFPSLASHMAQRFNQVAEPAGRSITFSQSCTCAPQYNDKDKPNCVFCNHPLDDPATKPIDVIVAPSTVEANQERMMDVQAELFELGLLPPPEDETEEPYVESPFEDESEEIRKGLHAGVLFPGQVRRYRGGGIKTPKVWSFKQTVITDYFNVV